MEYQKYIGIPYKDMNCARLALDIQEKEFGKKYNDYIEPKNDSPFSFSLAVRRNLPDYMDKISLPKHGCAVLMICRGRLSHIGTYLFIGNEGYILHTSESFQSSILTSIKDLKKYHIQIEGFYQWK